MGASRRKKQEEPEAYTFKELSEAAKDRAIEVYRDKNHDELFRHDDAQFLTELFQTDLEEQYGLGSDFKVYWSLGYCQGDGVCFEGTVDLETFLRKEKKLKKFGILIGRASAKITHDGQYCHYNSMDVEVESDVDARAFMSDEMQERSTDFQYEQSSRLRSQQEVRARRVAPIRAWEELVRNWERSHERVRYKKQDWTTRAPAVPPRPQELDIPIPEDLVMPEEIRQAWASAEAEYADFEKLLGEFEAYLDERVKEISKDLEKMGYAEIEHHSSSEYIAERLSDDDALYTEDGDLFED